MWPKVSWMRIELTGWKYLEEGSLARIEAIYELYWAHGRSRPLSSQALGAYLARVPAETAVGKQVLSKSTV